MQLNILLSKKLYMYLSVVWSNTIMYLSCDHIETTTQMRWILTLKNGCCFTDK